MPATIAAKGAWRPTSITLFRDYAHPSFIHLGRFEIDENRGGTEVVGSERTVRYDGMLQIVDQSRAVC